MTDSAVPPSVTPGGGAGGSDAVAPKKKKSRCAVCSKVLGLTGLACKCGNVYCGDHRYEDQHNCTYDYKKEHIDHLRKLNPVVGPSRLEEI